MNTAKKFFALLMALMLVLSLVACGEGETVSTDPSTNTSSKEETKPQKTEPEASEPENSEPSETEPTQTEPEEVEYVYTVRVVDVDGVPVSGVFVQVCAGSSCHPAQTDADGVAGFPTEITGDGELVAKIIPSTLNGYSIVDGIEEISMADGNTDVVFVVQKDA